MSQRTAAEAKPAARSGGDGRSQVVAGTSGTPGLAGTPLARREILNIAALCAAAFVFRLLFIGFIGHGTDIATFENWMLVLQQYGIHGFYSHVQYVDYPPGYMLFLWAAGQLHAFLDFVGLAQRGIDTMIISIKMPAILADVGLVYVVYLVMRRNWSTQVALVSAAIIAGLNPDIPFLSAYWGQADSVAALFMVIAIYLALTKWFEVSWLVLAFAVLIKPHPIAIAPLILLWQIRTSGWQWRILTIPVVSALVAYLGSVGFAPSAAPAALFKWLYGTYQHGAAGYPYNSVNAFNLYSIKNDFWQSDKLPVTVAGFELGPLWAWGIAIFCGFLIAIALRQWRTTGPDVPREQRENSFLFACFLVMLGYFILLTRMHERYLFSAIVLIVFARPLGPVQRIATLALASTFLVDLIYGLYYLKSPSADLNPILVHSLSALNVLVFFAVAGVYLIEEIDQAAQRWLTDAAPRAAPRASPQLLEGLVAFTRRDVWIAVGLTAASALLLIYRITVPNERIFDEIYYARSAQEYLHHQEIYESTHPPLTKLCMAATVWFFQVGVPSFGAWLAHQGVAFGDFFAKNIIGDPVSSRIACAIAGILMIPILYAFAKRLLGSTGGAVVAVLLLLTSGFYFVQARTALPDIFVALFSLAALYCGYRFFTAAQIVRRKYGSYPDTSSLWATAGVAVATVAFIALEVAFYDSTKHPPEYATWTFVVFMWLLATFCILWAFRLRREREEGDTVVYPDGSVVASGNVTFASGEQRPARGATWDDGVQKAAWGADGVALSEGETAVRWQAEGDIDAKTGELQIKDDQRWGMWLVLTGVSLGAVTACKWYGIFDVATLFLAAALVTATGLFGALSAPSGVKAKPATRPRRLVWGNPLGWRLPLFVGSIILLGFSVYTLTWIPYFGLGHNFQDMLSYQHGMYQYHHDLKATHIYSSPWWTWPLDIRPVAYYYCSFPGHPCPPTPHLDPKHVVGEVLALPNPIVWVFGLLTVPLAGVLAWRERHKGMLIVVAAMFLHWLPWVGSPRIDFQYNIFNNTTLLCLCTAYVLVRLWRWAAAQKDEPNRRLGVGITTAAYLAACVLSFAYFYPILSGQPITYAQWQERMWLNSGCQPDQKQDCVGWI